MQTNQTGRLVVIFTVLLASLAAIYFLGLKPGIDMVGGTSLLYQIKAPDAATASRRDSNGHTLAEQVMGSLKKRVDPDGVKNYIWRPQGNDRLEIQIPASPKTDEAVKARDTYVNAQRQLEATNISDAAVINAVENLTGDARKQKLDELAAGMPARKALFAQLAAKYDEMSAAEKAMNAVATAAASNDYDKLKAQVAGTNLSTTQLESALADTANRSASITQFKQMAGGYPARLTAIDNFTKAYDAYNVLKSSVTDSAELKNELRGSGVLAFHILALPGELSNVQYDHMIHQLHEKGPRPQAGDELQWFEVDRPEYTMNQAETWNGKKYILCWTTPDKSMANGPNTPKWTMQQAHAITDQQGMPAVSFQFDPQGGLLFHDLSSKNLHKELVTILDNKVISVANLNSIIGAEGELTNDNAPGYTKDELSYLVDTLNAGSLPAQLEDEPISEHTVGPQLGQANLRRGLYACGFGLIVVAAFLICYYYLAGVVATFAVFMNVAIILGVLAAFGATFTLPGIAGIVLTIGAAVDANVLIFERLREEQHRGLGLRMAMRNAYTHAQSAIFDSNATTVITSIILYWLGSEEVKGFGLTLLIGLISSLFTSLFVTRTIFNVLIDTLNVQNLSSFPLTFPKWDKFLKPDIDWMKKVPYFVAFSAVFIVLGSTAFIVKAKQGQLADVDFASGTQVDFDLNSRPNAPWTQKEVQGIFEKAGSPALPAFSVTSAGANDTSYEIITPNVDAKAVRTAIMSILGDRLSTDRPSTFDRSGDPIEKVLDTTVLPIDKPEMVVDGFKLPDVDDYQGGAVIVMRNITPPLPLDQIRNRLDNQRVQEQAAQGNSDTAIQFHDFTVVTPTAAGLPTSMAVVLVKPGDFPYDKDQTKWLQDVANPMWRLVNDGINRQGQLQKVNNFDAQVAGDTQAAAIYSLILSSLVIMTYIWFRFGNLKYGAATVLAMIHDVMLVVGAVGLSHWLVQYLPPVAHLLMVDAFRVNLTIVAAVLTVMSYSMIDTIVVFDRIRENRGKFGHLSRQIVNDSINQTLSRTLLTAGTTIVTVAGMYVVGGPGIHGFTFVLLVGILVGTYSSIAIAAPILLWGVAQTDGGKGKSDKSAVSERTGVIPAVGAR